MSSMVGKIMRLIGSIALTCLLSMAIPSVVGATVGDRVNQIEQYYGQYDLVQDDTARIGMATEWLGNGQRRPRAYGYLKTVNGLPVSIWVEYDQQGQVKKETTLLGDSIKLRYFGNYFPLLRADLAAPDSSAVIIGAFPKDQLGVVVHVGDELRLVRLFLADTGDKTKINFHSRLKGFEVTVFDQATAADKLAGKVNRSGVEAGNRALLGRGDWRRTDNFFRDERYFSDKLVARQRTELIVIHHTAGENLSVDDIHDLHLTKGWAGIGYHKVILADGTVVCGRPEGTIGAHAAGANPRSIGIALVGNFEQQPPTPAQMAALINLTRQLMLEYQLRSKQVVPHRAVTKGTVCPGAMFPWQEFIRRLSKPDAGVAEMASWNERQGG